MISADTARFLLDLLGKQQLSIGAPDFDQAVERVMIARTELTSVIGDEPADGAGKP